MPPLTFCSDILNQRLLDPPLCRSVATPAPVSLPPKYSRSFWKKLFLWGETWAFSSSGQLPQQSLMFGRKFLRHVDVHPNNQIPAAWAVQSRHSLAPQDEFLTVLSSWRNFQRLATFQSWHFDRGPQNGLGVRDGYLADQVVAVAGGTTGVREWQSHNNSRRAGHRPG